MLTSKFRLLSNRTFSTITPTSSIQSIISTMKDNNISRSYLIYKNNNIITSNPIWNNIASSLLNDKRDYHNHEAIFLQIGKQSGALFSATLHNTIRGQGAGGVRHWEYPSIYDFLRDGLRLSQGMGRKNALAGLWHGGGKGVIAANNKTNDLEYRKLVYSEYGSFVTSLNGCYVTAEDLGTTPIDMARVFAKTRFTTCIPPNVGGSGNPSILTGYGVAAAIEGALAFHGQDIKGKSVAIQGLGNVSQFLIQKLLELGVKKIIGTDVNPAAVNSSKLKFPDIECKLVPLNDNSILSSDVDIVSPCALGGTLNSKTIPTIKAKIVCGAANNQLLDDTSDDKLISNRGITYVPDFLANRMGITNCANESYGYVDNDPAIYKHFSKTEPLGIYLMTGKVLERARDSKISTAQAAIEIADKLMMELHPIWGHRGQQIIDSLVKNKWETQDL